MKRDEGDDLLRELGQELPWDRPDRARRDSVRSRIVVEAAEGEPPALPLPVRRRWVVAAGGFAAGALAAAAILLLLLQTRDTPALRPHAAEITASPEARVEHRSVATETGVDEIVQVEEGTVRVATDRAHTGDRVRLHTADAELEGAGELEVVVVARSLSSVTVRSGAATLRIHGQRTVVLAAGQSWRATAPIVASDLSPAPPVVATPDRQPARDPVKPRPRISSTAPVDRITPPPPVAPAVEPTPPTTTTPRQQLERRFQHGWKLLRAGQPREAALELGAAADAAPTEPLAADARYWQAVALVKAGQGRDAEHVLRAFLDGAPRSLRRGRAAVLLAQLLARRGEAASARAWFQSAVDDPDPETAAAARRGLDAR